MDKALRGEAAVLLPQDSNNAGHGSFRLARRVKSFQLFYLLRGATNCAPADCSKISFNALLLFLFSYWLKRFYAMFGLDVISFQNRFGSLQP